MKTKVTITLDRELVPVAKSYAATHGKSLSAVIEASLRRMTQAEEPSFSSKWRGRFRAAELDQDARYRHLAEKYL